MMQGGFIAPSINVKTLDPALRPEEIVTETRDAELDTILSNSFGFGGTNATLAVSKYHG
jgi:3-oxoacyl-[acyl-carrier-protein] synthase-1